MHVKSRATPKLSSYSIGSDCGKCLNYKAHGGISTTVAWPATILFIGGLLHAGSLSWSCGGIWSLVDVFCGARIIESQDLVLVPKFQAIIQPLSWGRPTPLRNRFLQISRVSRPVSRPPAMAPLRTVSVRSLVFRIAFSVVYHGSRRLHPMPVRWSFKVTF